MWCGVARCVIRRRDRARERVTERECVCVIEGECGRVRKGTHTQHTHTIYHSQTLIPRTQTQTQTQTQKSVSNIP